MKLTPILEQSFMIFSIMINYIDNFVEQISLDCNADSNTHLVKIIFENETYDTLTWCLI